MYPGSLKQGGDPPGDEQIRDYPLPPPRWQRVGPAGHWRDAGGARDLTWPPCCRWTGLTSLHQPLRKRDIALRDPRSRHLIFASSAATAFLFAPTRRQAVLPSIRWRPPPRPPSRCPSPPRASRQPLRPAALSWRIAPAVSVQACPVRAGADEEHEGERAIAMMDKALTLPARNRCCAGSRAWPACPRVVDFSTVRGTQFLEPCSSSPASSAVARTLTSLLTQPVW